MRTVHFSHRYLQDTAKKETVNFYDMQEQYYKKGCRVFHGSLSGF